MIRTNDKVEAALALQWPAMSLGSQTQQVHFVCLSLGLLLAEVALAKSYDGADDANGGQKWFKITPAHSQT